MTCHNRVEKTLGCLDALMKNALPPGTSLEVFLVDDNSSDGTGRSVSERFPDVTVLKGGGSLFWNGGMRLAFEHVARRDFDFHLWLNDDTHLSPDAIERLVATEEQVRQRVGMPVIIVGTTQDPKTGKATYGGQRRRGRWRLLQLDVVQAGSAPQRCDTFNGNCALVPREIYRALGNLDATFRHAMGDTDYGFRANKAGFGIWAMPGFAGTCVIDHTRHQTYLDVELPLRERFRRMFQPKGLPPRAWLTLTRRHCGPLWPAYFLWPYGKVIVTWVLRALRRQPAPTGGAASSRRN